MLHTRRKLLRGGGALAATKLFAPSIIKPASAGFVLGKAGGGGGGGYVAKAVHFDGLTSLQIPAVVAPASSATIISSHWQKIAPENWRVGDVEDVPAVWVVDPLGQYEPQFSFSTVDPGAQPQIDFNAGDPTAGPFYDLTSSILPVPGVGVYQHFLCAAKVDFASGSKLGKVYLNDTDITNVNSDTFGSFLIQMNGFLFCIGNDAGFDTPLIGALCDLRVALNYDPFVDGDLPVAFRRLFIDASGKPVDPAVATAALGGPGIVLCSGDASPTGFSRNQGIGGTIIVTAGGLTNATTSPSD